MEGFVVLYKTGFMNIEDLREYILLKENVSEGFPFGGDTLVFKVNNKMFLLVALNENPLQFNVKCKPEKAIHLREKYPENILPGYHMNKKHWNTIIADGRLSEDQLKEMINESYGLVVK
jgi:predicted DNA-binding protein (MmcQ/YjbR family)